MLAERVNVNFNVSYLKIAFIVILCICMVLGRRALQGLHVGVSGYNYLYHCISSMDDLV
jgi:hypothetical protein